MLDGAASNIPDPDDLVFSTSGKILSVGAEADASDVEVSIFGQTTVLEMGDWVTSLDIENLRGPVATSRDPPTIQAEANTANHTLMG